MKIEQASAGGVAIFRIHGSVDSTTSHELQAAVVPGIAPPAHRLVLDFTDVPFVSSAGLRVVLMAAKQAKSARGGFAIFGLGETVREVFETSGFNRVIRIATSETDAVEAAAS
jgi:anti-anti-sigma factor